MSRFRAIPGVGLAFVIVSGGLADPEPSRIGQRLRQRLTQSLPAYDPAIREAARLEAADDAPPDVSRRAGRTPADQVKEDNASSMELPPFIVEAEGEARPSRSRPTRLPILPRAVPFKNVAPQPFETKGETEQRLAETHLSALDRLVLNRATLPGVGKTQGERAREQALIDRNARTLNRLALMIEVLEASGASPDEVRALRKEYTRLFVVRPK